MAVSSDTDKTRPQQVGHTVAEISEKASLLVREEIALARAEVTQKATRLGKGAAVAGIAGVLALFGFIMFLHFAAWGFAEIFDAAWLGYLTVTVILFVLAAIAGLIGMRWIKKGAPPTPDMAIEEAKAIRETVKNP